MHVITFLRQLQKFSQDNGVTSMLEVDKSNTVEDVFDVADTTGRLIADIDNNLSEIIDKLEEYYIRTNNSKLMYRLKKQLR
jgi:hypothetical protein